jgi:hypothetical protein
LNQLETLEDVRNIVKSSNPGLHDSIRQGHTVNYSCGKVQIDFGQRL